jgi:3-hydroxypropanoate dehydrogenase
LQTLAKIAEILERIFASRKRHFQRTKDNARKYNVRSPKAPLILRRFIVSNVLSNEDLDIIFRNARTHTFWLEKPVEDSLLRQVYDLAKMGPTSANMCPMRIVFVKTREAKERLKPALDQGNVDKTMKAPVTAIIGMDIHFYEQMPKLFPHADAKAWFKDLPDNILEYIALRNGSLQGAYFILAARSLGLDCGPMSGFNNAKVDAEFFAGTTIKSNFLCNLGHGDASKLHPRSPRLTFEEACKVV